ncbi:peptidoglycan DD-metalloendopeptidase family protein [Streptomyces sp. NBC_00239]|uniref:peptidoglycan DD-metalloendopeptidase family protein n=1 Tax=Streptomyces sp. NBC_00239 TaxID=2903640 RepID=UPI002E284ACC|nr:peptidoglycan DD-metalloendopeptidase family protein [Streptomyces sp. NBC_00239]
MPDLDVVGGAAVDVVPIVPNFHSRLKAQVLPIADRVGREAGERMGREMARHIAIAIPSAVTSGGRAATRSAGSAGDDAGGAFARSLRRKLEIAYRSMPRLDVRLSDTGVDAQLARIRARLETLSSRRIGIDVSAEAAVAEVTRLEEQLRRLGATHPNVAVRADTATARAALAEIRAEIAAVDAADPRVKVDVDTAAASSALLHLTAQVAVLAALPAAPALLAGLGGIAAMATAGAAGLGALALVAVPAIKGITEALQAKRAADEDASKASTNGAAVAVQAAQRALQMAGAQDTLAAAHRNAARTIAQANRAVEDAERALAQASQRAADQRRQAAENVARAERSLVDAKRNAQRAEEDLTQAREAAAQQLRDLNDQVVEGALTERGAVLRVQRAREELARVMKDPTATDLQRAEAQLAYDEAVEQARQQKRDLAELRKERDKAAKEGVDGSERVKTAQERLRDAQQAVIDETKAVADAQTAAARAQVEAAQTVADAQRRVADAVENAANASVQAAESVEAAERGVESARLSGIDTTTQAITKSDEYRKALAKLTPEGRKLFDAIAGPSGLSAAFKAWHKDLQPAVLPLFTRGVNGAKAALPGLTPLVLAAARGIDTLMDKASTQLKNPFWTRFKQGIKDEAETAIVGLGVAIGNVLKGAAGIVDAFLPHMDGIAAASDRITARFAKWGTSLRGSPDFERFLAYVKETSPGLAAFIGDLLRAALDVAKALAPLSVTMFAVMTPLINGLSWLATNAPGVIQVLWGLYFAQKAIALGMVAFEAAMFIYSVAVAGATLVTAGWAAALAATGIVPLIAAIVIAVALFAAGIIWAYKNVDWFRDLVDASWAFIKATTLALWNGALKPTFTGIWWLLKRVGDIAVWVWQNALGPSFRFIWEAAKMLFQILAVAVLTPIYLLLKTLGATAMWLWEAAIRPTFRFFADIAVWLWEKHLQPVFRDIQAKFEIVGKVAKSVYDTYIKPAFTAIGDLAGWLYRVALKPQFDMIETILGLMGKAFDGVRDHIGKAWAGLKDLAKGPVEFIAKVVYNGGVVPVWNAVAKITGAGKLDEFKGFHTGGIMSGYSPGRDDRVIAVGGGEAVMRPEWTRVIGADRINSWNAAARTGGISGVQRAIAGGMPAYADGGIVGWLKGAGSSIGDVLKGGWDALTNPGKIFDELASGVKNQVSSLGRNPWATSMADIPARMIVGLKRKVMEWFDFSGGGAGGIWGQPVNAKYGTKFGVAGSMWASGHHTGLDFPAAIGTLIRAVAAGRVTMATGGGPYGNHVMINHGSGLSSLYAHMSSIGTALGKSVARGDVIGRVGDTGNTTGPHLHLEARVNNRPVDPMQYLTAGGARGSGGRGVQRWRGTVAEALNLVGQPAGLVDTTLRRMHQESGGDPLAVNRTDINWRNGTPSVGLLQVIKPTFDAYAGAYRNVGPKLYGVSTNPLANIYASMRYALSRYGSLPAAYDRPGGYGNGGFPGIGETAWVGEHGPELVRFLSPAQVYSSTDSQAMVRQAASLRRMTPATGGAQVHADVRVFVGDREITDIVRTEVDAYDAATAAAIDTGVWT